MVKMKIIALVMLSFLLLNVSSIFAVPPPAESKEVLVEMRKFDESFTAGKWEEVSGATARMEQLIKEIFVQNQLDDFVLEEALEDVKKYVLEKKNTEVEASYTAFQKQYFNFISHFDHDVHPILQRVEQLVMGESQEAMTNKNYDAVVRYMNTASILVEHGKTVLANKGVPEQEINIFKSKVIALSSARTKEDYTNMGDILGQLQKTYGSFMSR